jgi:hypothetical protein
MRTGRAKRLGGGRADAAARAGDEGDAPFKECVGHSGSP